MKRTARYFYALIVAAGSLILLTGCPNPAQSDDGGGSGSSSGNEVDLTLTNAYGRTIDVHFGEWDSRTAEASSTQLTDGEGRLFASAPPDKSTELWFSYNDGVNYLWLVVDDTGNPYQFLFETGKSYELRFTPTAVEFYIDGNAEFGAGGSGDDSTTGDDGSSSSTVAAPTFSPLTTTHFDGAEVTLSSTTTDALIYYTTDGTEPTTASTLYSGPFTLAHSATVKAIALKNGVTSTVSTQEYTVYPNQGTVGKVEKVLAVSDQIFYALDSTNQALLKFDVQINSVVDNFPLDYSGPVDMEYDSTNNAIYVIYKLQSEVSVFELASGEFGSPISVNTPAGSQMTGIEVDSANNRLYVVMADSNGFDYHLRILDTAGTAKPAPATTIEGPLLEYDPTNRYLFAANDESSPATIQRWDVSGDTLAGGLSSNNLGSNGNHVAVSADGGHLAFFTGSGNDNTNYYTVYDIDPASSATDGSGDWAPSMYDEWDTGAYPRYGLFSPDSTYFYALGDFDTDTMIVYSVNSHSPALRSLTVPNLDDYAKAAVSPDGTVMVAFTYDTYNDSEHYLHTVTDIRE